VTVAALPMYAAPGAALQAFWQALAALLQAHSSAALPETLSRPDDLHAHWLRDDLLLSQTCGFPLSTALGDQVQVLGAFAYTVAGADGVQCRSQLVCRSSDARTRLEAFQGSTLAYNSTDSQSGYNALRALVAGSSSARPFFGQSIGVGSHAQALASVLAGAADMAAIDCVTLALWQRDNPAMARGIRVFGETEPYPGLPLITARSTAPARVEALRSALASLATEPRFATLRAPLLIGGFAALELADYAPCLQMQAQALALGLHTL